MKATALFLLILCLTALCSCRKANYQPDGAVFETVTVGGITQQRRFSNDQTSDIYDDFYLLGHETVIIPGLEQGIVPQGMDVMEEEGLLLISGYFEEDKASVILAVELKQDGRLVKALSLQGMDGAPFKGHVGGVAVTPDKVCVTGAGCLYLISRETVVNAGASDTVRFENELPLMTNASFCNYSNNILWVGDFYLEKTYPTDEYRHMINRDGSKYCAWACGYDVESLMEETVSSGEKLVPNFIFSIRDKIQGMTMLEDGTIVLSESYGRKNDSNIFYYKAALDEEPHSFYEDGDMRIPVWFLDSGMLIKTVAAPPMAEGICAVGDDVFILFESAADKYSSNLVNNARNPIDSVWRLGR